MTSTWTNPDSMFEHQPVGAAKPPELFWADIEAIVGAQPAAQSDFVRAVIHGDAPATSVARFVRDLVEIGHELPLIQGEIASRAALHGVDTVILLSHGATMAFGYQSHPPLDDLLARLAAAAAAAAAAAGDASGASSISDAGTGEASLAATAFLVCVRSLGLEWFEAGLTTMLVDRDWNDVAPLLSTGLHKHYGFSEHDLECFAALADFSGPRTEAVPSLLREIAASAYHQRLVVHAAREVTTMWNNLWSSWNPTNPTRTASPMEA